MAVPLALCCQDRWPHLIPTLLTHLNSGDPRRIHNVRA